MTITSRNRPVSSFIVWFLSCSWEMSVVSVVAIKAVAFRRAVFLFSLSFLFTVLSDFFICSCCSPWKPVCKSSVGDDVARVVQAESPKPDST